MYSTKLNIVTFITIIITQTNRSNQIMNILSEKLCDVYKYLNLILISK